jgi:hypothetical protein
MSNDDLPPPRNPPERRSLAEQLGETFGAAVWIVGLLACAGAIGFGLIHWFR